MKFLLGFFSAILVAVSALFFYGKKSDLTQISQFEKLAETSEEKSEEGSVADFEKLIKNGPNKKNSIATGEKVKNVVVEATVDAGTPVARNNLTEKKLVKPAEAKVAPVEKKASTSVVQYSQLFIDGKSTESSPLLSQFFIKYYFKGKLTPTERQTLTKMFASFKNTDEKKAEAMLFTDGKVRRCFQTIGDDGTGSLHFSTVVKKDKVGKVVKKKTEQKYSNNPHENFLIKEALKHH